MTAGTLFFVVIGAATVTGWLFKIIEVIEREPQRARR